MGPFWIVVRLSKPESMHVEIFGLRDSDSLS